MRPFLYAVLLFSLSYLGIAISLFPMIVPHHYDLWQAASSPDTQIFLGVGTLFLLPIILLYTGWRGWEMVYRYRTGVEEAPEQR